MALVKAVQRAFTSIAPVSLAEAWDNTGLILQPTFARPHATKVLLTIDLTPAVADEALAEQSKVGCIVAYHPPIFRGLKSFTLEDPLQTSILRCAAAGVGVYSPHTALDSVVGGINDLLAVFLSDDPERDYITGVSGEQPPLRPGFKGLSGVGIGGGRTITLANGISLNALISRIKSRLGLTHVQLAKSTTAPSPIRRIGVCAGSGSAVLTELGYSSRCDAFLTGEMSHHEILAAVSRGVHVVLTNHTNTERLFLRGALQNRLQAALDDARSTEGGGATTEAAGERWEVIVSEADRDPLETV